MIHSNNLAANPVAQDLLTRMLKQYPNKNWYAEDYERNGVPRVAICFTDQKAGVQVTAPTMNIDCSDLQPDFHGLSEADAREIERFNEDYFCYLHE